MRRFLVFGKVQGVYFRHSARLEANRLGLRGSARNLPDGSVEVLVQGAVAAVAELREWLRHGPAQARVDEVRDVAPDHAPALGTSPLGASAVGPAPLKEGFFII